MEKMEDVIVRDSYLKDILYEHSKWLMTNGNDGKQAVINKITFKNIRFENYNFKKVDFSECKFIDCLFENVYFNNSVLDYVLIKNSTISTSTFSNCDMEGSTLNSVLIKDSKIYRSNMNYLHFFDFKAINTSFKRTQLSKSIFDASDFNKCDLSCANLFDSIICKTKFENIETSCETLFYEIQCPEEGSFIGYKKAGYSNDYLVKLLIPEDALRTSATTYKCRCNKAKVLSITDITTGEEVNRCVSNYNHKFIYTVGKMIEEPEFDIDRWNECSKGIHFFMNKNHALKY